MPIDDLEKKRPRPAEEDGAHVYLPDQPDWDFWKQRNGCRLWCAVLLSMNIEPSVSAREELRDRAPDKYQQYKKRLKIVNGACHLNSTIPPVEHPLSGAKSTERFVRVTDILKFGLAANWLDVSIFNDGMTNDSSIPSGASKIIKESDVKEIVFDDLQKGEKYSVLRFGALLQLVEIWMKAESFPNKTAFLNGNQLNYSAIGREMELLLSKKDNAGKLQPMPNFRAQANSKRAAEAVKAVQTL